MRDTFLPANHVIVFNKQTLRLAEGVQFYILRNYKWSCLHPKSRSIATRVDKRVNAIPVYQCTGSNVKQPNGRIMETLRP